MTTPISEFVYGLIGIAIGMAIMHFTQKPITEYSQLPGYENELPECKTEGYFKNDFLSKGYVHRTQCPRVPTCDCEVDFDEGVEHGISLGNQMNEMYKRDCR